MSDTAGDPPVTPRPERLRSAVAGLLLALAGLAALPAAGQQVVQFDSLDRSGTAAVLLKGHWFAAPSGPQPAPAVVLLHGCNGAYARQSGQLSEHLRRYAAMVNAQGFHALVLDSLTPRGETELCTQRLAGRRVTMVERRRDALAALAWLAARNDVDPARVGLLGWSHGGSSVLAAMNERQPEVAAAAVQARFGVAFYPGCAADVRSGFTTEAPLLMLIGEADDWTPAAPCHELARVAQGRSAPRVASYPGAYHAFDTPGPVRLRRDVPNGVNPGQGVHVGGDAEARRASEQALAGFLAEVRGP